MANFAAAFKTALDASALNNDAVAAQAGKNETTVNVADNLTSSNNQDAVLAALKVISDRLDKVAAAAAAAAERTRTQARRPRATDASPA